MSFSLLETAPYIYLGVQSFVTIIISIFGALVVRKSKQQRQLVDLQAKHESFCKLWIKVVWKMRSVYGSLIVHIFDVFTDLVVIIEWFSLEDGKSADVPHIDTHVMAINGLVVLGFHKLISVFVFWRKEGNVSRCILQFFDLLVIQEIYVAHLKIVYNYDNMNKVNNNSRQTDVHVQKDQQAETQAETEAGVTSATIKANNKVTDIDSTTSFKMIRSLEAIFESIPQSVLQLGL